MNIFGPDFVIAGAMRCGTTALAQALDAHPEIGVTKPKEPNYFATLHGALNFSGPGDQWFATQNVYDLKAYSTLLAQLSSRIRGEASAMYLSLPRTARSIHRVQPNARIILVLRDPVRRAVSAHGYLVTRGRERVRSFAEACSLEEERRRDGYGPIWWYQKSSDYRAGVGAYLSAFGPGQVHVITAETMSQDPDATLRGIFDFLDVPYHPRPGMVLADPINGGGVSRSALLTRALYPNDALRRRLRGAAPSALVRAIRQARAASRQPAKAPVAVPAPIRDRLLATIADVELMLNRSLPEWDGEA
jgi:hypothetical protein